MRTLKVATAECFTHCEIGKKLHLVSAPYSKYPLPLRVVFSSFIPSVEVAKRVLGVELPPPTVEVNGIKVYTEEVDKEVTRLLAKGLVETFGVDVAIATSAGVGRGAITLWVEGEEETFTTEVEVDFTKATPEEIEMRKTDGVRKAILHLLKKLREKGLIEDEHLLVALKALE
jgi:uncharacterized protein (UPF0254 family)